MTDILELPMPARNRKRAAALLVTVIVAAFLCGVLLDRYVLARPIAVLHDSEFHPLSEILRSPTDADRLAIRQRLSGELHLSPAQDTAISRIMTRKAGEFQALRDELRPRVELLVAEVRREIEQVLTPAQREDFHRLQAREARTAPSSNGQE
jgi:hypothetical protein